MKRRHTRSELRELLGLAEERPEITVRYVEAPQLPAPARDVDEVFVMWSAARAEANLAYDAWCARPGADAYAVYRAAEDRADAAEAALALSLPA
jgi:hypothetical protein